MCDCADLICCPPRLRKPKTKYYLQNEVVIHNQPNDIWVIINGRVLDLTQIFAHLCPIPNKPLIELLAYAGKDISHFFNKDGTPKTAIHLDGSDKYILHSAYQMSTVPLQAEKGLYWWNDPLVEIGKTTSDERRLRIINTLIKSTIIMTVCEEDTINDIKAKYTARYNRHAGGYIWRKKSRDGTQTGRLSFDRTLTENAIFKEKIENEVPPALWLFFKDGFTVA